MNSAAMSKMSSQSNMEEYQGRDTKHTYCTCGLRALCLLWAAQQASGQFPTRQEYIIFMLV